MTFENKFKLKNEVKIYSSFSRAEVIFLFHWVLYDVSKCDRRNKELIVV